MMTAVAAQRTARIAGFAYLAIFALATFANFFVFEPLAADDDAMNAARNIVTAEPLFRAGIAAFIVVLAADVIAGWALFVVLRPVDPSLSLLALLFRMAYTVAHLGIVLSLLSALSFAREPALIDGLSGGAPALSYFFLTSHGVGFTVTLVFFGVHLLLLGALIARSRYIPRWIGWLVALAGFAYALDGLGTILLGSYGAFADLAAMSVIVPALLGEGALMLWLILRGVDKTRFPETHAPGFL
jgi:hypothetical protein